MKGTYLLVLKLKKDISIIVGKLGFLHFQKGYYVYVGSALNGLEQRIKRHLSRDKKIHWHIDYLLPYTEIIKIFYKENIKKKECEFARVFKKQLHGIPGFGCSDCKCTSHLFYGISEEIMNIINTLLLEVYLLKTNF